MLQIADSDSALSAAVTVKSLFLLYKLLAGKEDI